MPEKMDYENVEFIDFAVDYAVPRTGEQGYLVLPGGCSGLGDDSLCYFREREDCEVIIDGPEMSIYGMIAKEHSFMAVVTGMTYDYKLVARVEKGEYFVFPRFMLHGREPYEKIEVRIESLPDGSDYNHDCSRLTVGSGWIEGTASHKRTDERERSTGKCGICTIYSYSYGVEACTYTCSGTDP